MRLCLVPVGCGAVIVATMIGVSVLDRHTDGAGEHHRIFQVIAVQRDATRPVWSAGEDHTVLWSRIDLCRAPGRIEVVFGAGSVQPWRPGLAVDEDHIVAFAIPVPLVGQPQVVDVQVAAYVVTGALGVKEQIVAFSIGVLVAELERLVGEPGFVDTVTGVFPAPAGVETQEVVRQGAVGLVVDIVVEPNSFRVLVDHLEPRAPSERHGEEAVQSLPVLRAHSQRATAEVGCLCVSHPEEVPEWGQHTWLILTVPEESQRDVSQVRGARGVGHGAACHPYVGDAARAGQLCRGEGLPR